MVKDSEEGRKNLILIFPRLSSDRHFDIRSRRSDRYNCIAWAMRMPCVWIDPHRVPGHWWPGKAPADMLYPSLVEAFRCVGFEVCSDDGKEFLYDKVALYRKGEFWTHAARVVGECRYHSKIGRLWDISHGSGDVFSGTHYGECFCFMKRPKAKRMISLLVRAGILKY